MKKKAIYFECPKCGETYDLVVTCHILGNRLKPVCDKCGNAGLFRRRKK